MRRPSLILAAVAAMAAPALAEDKRGLGAHVHGHGALNIAVEGAALLMELEVPGADIVGFEHPAESAEDRAAIDEAIATLAKPQDLFVIPAAAGCVVTAAEVALITEGDDHDGHDHEEHAEGEKHDDHDHEEHAEGEKHDDHDHEEHAEGEKHDHDHDHEEHAEGEKHDDHDHAEHAEEEGGHTEFHAEYAMTCADPAAVTKIDFAYFDRFPNAEELEIQFVSSKGAKGFDVDRGAPTLDLAGSI